MSVRHLTIVIILQRLPCLGREPIINQSCNDGDELMAMSKSLKKKTSTMFPRTPNKGEDGKKRAEPQEQTGMDGYTRSRTRPRLHNTPFPPAPNERWSGSGRSADGRAGADGDGKLGMWAGLSLLAWRGWPRGRHCRCNS
ncbi:hypothetical protein QBC45DRAFT_423220, partial [Copromyces sp. CBS 386.78]